MVAGVLQNQVATDSMTIKSERRQAVWKWRQVSNVIVLPTIPDIQESRKQGGGKRKKKNYRPEEELALPKLRRYQMRNMDGTHWF